MRFDITLARTITEHRIIEGVEAVNAQQAETMAKALSRAVGEVSTDGDVLVGQWLRDSDPSAERVSVCNRVPERVPTSALPPDGQELFEMAHEGSCDEWQLVAGIKAFLRSPEEKAWLDAQDLSIEDVLNGRFVGEGEVLDTIQAMFTRWNGLIGRQQFGF